MKIENLFIILFQIRYIAYFIYKCIFFFSDVLYNNKYQYSLFYSFFCLFNNKLYILIYFKAAFKLKNKKNNYEGFENCKKTKKRGLNFGMI